MSDWESENRRYQSQAPVGPYNPCDYNWSQEPPVDGVCRECYEWRRYPEGQRHFGLAWWRVCGHDCPHGHHRDEVWIG